MKTVLTLRFDVRKYLRLAAFTLLLGPLGWSLSPRDVEAGDGRIPEKGSFTVEVFIHFRGDLLALDDGHSFWVGDGKGLTANRAGSGFMHHASVVMLGVADIKGSAVSNDAYGVIADMQGDKIFCKFVLSSKEGGAGTAIEGTSGQVEFQGGTGKYKGIKGRAKATYRDVAVREAGASLEGEGAYLLDGQWTLP